NVIDIWSPEMRNHLSYCVSNDFDAFKPRILQALDHAMRDWESAAGVTFVHLAEEDDHCDSANPRVLFNIEPSINEAFLAAAFFPSYPRNERHLIVDQSSFDFDDVGLAGIVRHELGHVLGFRHEHISADSDMSCPEDASFKPLTSYDRKSVMHYPQCGGENDIRNLVLTDFDRKGSAIVYPSRLPRS
ncbi:MAG: matrixin family metalloprotease, partial [Bdellovibrionota bacterium]